ncbi:unnamed protein product, partial [marine sediment metagenome]
MALRKVGEDALGSVGGGAGVLAETAGRLRSTIAVCEIAAVSRTVLVVGGGGLEHALVRALAASGDSPRVLCAPGNVGIADHAELCDVAPDDVAGLAALARGRSVDLAVIGAAPPLLGGVG